MLFYGYKCPTGKKKETKHKISITPRPLTSIKTNKIQKQIARRASISIEEMNTESNILPVGH